MRLLAAFALLPAAACAESGGSAPGRGQSYALVGAAGWELRGGSRADDPDDLTSHVEPGLAWYVEYERLVPADGATEGQDLRLSGHQLPLDEHVKQLRYPFDGATINDLPASTYAGSDGPAMVLVAVADERTVLLISYALKLPELQRIAETDMRFVEESEWVRETR